jgi:enoyl-CoA hydratase
MTTTEPLVIVESADRVTTITLNRPEHRNALNQQLLHELWDAVTEAGADPAIGAIVLTGADPAFCAGVDLKEVSGEVPPSAEARPPGHGPERASNGLYRFLPVIEKPVIAAINGVAVTGGLEIALQCTFMVASERARFADTHGRIGIMPGGGMTVLLARDIGWRKAVELSLTGNFLGADEALRLGLVNHVVPHEQLLPTAQSLAADIAGVDPASTRRLLQHYRELSNAATIDDGHRIEGDMAESWQPGTSHVAARRSDVTARGRTQASG